MILSRGKYEFAKKNLKVVRHANLIVYHLSVFSAFSVLFSSFESRTDNSYH